MLKRILGFVIVIYFVSMGYLYLSQDKLIFPHHIVSPIKIAPHPQIEEINLYIDEETTLNGLFYKSKKQNAPLIIFFGGNGSDATEFLEYCDVLYDYDIVSLNYRGYIKSSGKPSEEALFSDAITIYNTFSKGQDIILIGRSLGSGVASYLASKKKVDKLILITPYDSILSVAQEKYFYFPIKLLLNHHFDTMNYINKVDCDIFVIEVKNDITVPNNHTKKLLEFIQTPPKHIVLDGVTHGNVLKHPNLSNYIKNFIQ